MPQLDADCYNDEEQEGKEFCFRGREIALP
jgi:hypothetical protein